MPRAWQDVSGLSSGDGRGKGAGVGAEEARVTKVVKRVRKIVEYCILDLDLGFDCGRSWVMVCSGRWRCWLIDW